MSKRTRSTYGFEILFNDLRMLKKMVKHTFIVLFFLQILIFIVSFIIFFGVDQTIFMFKYYAAKAFNYIFPKVTLKITLYTANTQIIFDQLKQSFYHSFLAILVVPFLFIVFKKASLKKQSSQHIRGSLVLSDKELSKKLASSKEKLELWINKNITLPANAETKHFLAIGKTGTGKTQLIGRIIVQLKSQQKKMLVYDYKGDFIEYFYNSPRDLIFNPLDSRSLKWNIFNDIKYITDLEIITKALIPLPAKGEAYFIEGARDVLHGLLLWCWNYNYKTNADLWEACSKSIEETENMIRETPGAERALKYFGSEKTSASVLSTMMQYVKIFEYMQHMDGDFSVAEWVKNGKGTIFIASNSTLEDTLRPIISLFVDLASLRVLNLKEDKDRRIYFFIDEFATLQKLNSVSNLLNLGRSKGASVWLGFQSLGQVNEKYGEDLAEAIINGCSSSFMFGLSSPTTAEFISKKIGEYEEYEVDSNTSYAIDTKRDGFTFSSKKKKEYRVLPSEFLNLAEMHFYLKINNFDIAKSSLDYIQFKSINEPFIPIDGITVDDVVCETFKANKTKKEANSIYIHEEEFSSFDVKL